MEKADAVCSRSQGAREGPDSGIFFCTTCAQVGLLLCERLQVVALKTKVYRLYSLTLCQRRGCPGSRSLLLFVQRFLFAARCFAAKSGYYVSQLLPQTLGLPGYPSLYRLSPAQLISVACTFTSVSL